MLVAGERVEISYTITNQASRQDSFDLSVDYIPLIGWSIEEEQRPSIVINPGASTTFYIAVTAPSNAQANDMAPEFKPILTSTRSDMQYEGPSFNNIIIETLYDSSITILSQPDVLAPGGITIIQADLQNNGNGPTSVHIGLIGSPSSWTYDVRMDGIVLDEPSIDLGVAYMGTHTATIDVLLYVPMTEAAREIHTVTIGITADGEDINPEDNQDSVDMITGSIHFPELNGSIMDIHALTGSTQQINASVTNVGNALESSMDVGFTVSTSPPTSEVVAFLTAGVGGPTSSAGETLTFPMSAGTTKMLFFDIIIGEDVPLNTRIVITLFVEGGQDDEGNLIRLEHQNLIMVDQQRKINMTMSGVGNITIEDSAISWFNITSYSTQTENIEYSFSYPEQWQLRCDDTLLSNGQSVNASLPFTRNTESIKDIRCEIQRLGGSYIGDVIITATNEDSTIQFTNTQTYVFAKPAPEESFFSKNLNGPTMIAGAFGIIIFSAILLILRKQRGEFAEEEEIVAGPPISQPVVVEASTMQPTQSSAEPEVPHAGPSLPEGGLPDGWSMEQWVHYGQQYLDRLDNHP